MTQHLDPSLVSLKAPTSFAAEQYQGLRMSVEQLRRLRDVRLVAVTSPSAGDGKTVTSINLAAVLSSGSDTRVLLIDADLRRPAIAPRLGIDNPTARGLVDAVTDEQLSLGDVTQKVNGGKLSVVPSGVARVATHEILRSPRLARLLREAREQYDYVVLDTPPLLPVFDSAMVAKLVDGLFLVVSANQTPRKLLAEALALLDPSSVLGIVFNRDKKPLFGYYGSAYRAYFREAGAA
jgi:protein-tyrosine kinase